MYTIKVQQKQKIKKNYQGVRDSIERQPHNTTQHNTTHHTTPHHNTPHRTASHHITSLIKHT